MPSTTLHNLGRLVLRNDIEAIKIQLKLLYLLLNASINIMNFQQLNID